MCICEFRCFQIPKERASDPSELKLKAMGVYPALMLGTKLGSSAKAIYAYNHLFRTLSNDTFETESYLGWVLLKLTTYLKMRLTLSFLASASVLWCWCLNVHYHTPLCSAWTQGFVHARPSTSSPCVTHFELYNSYLMRCRWQLNILSNLFSSFKPLHSALNFCIQVVHVVLQVICNSD